MSEQRDDLAEAVRKTVAEAPPLTQAQIDALSVLLGSTPKETNE